MAWQRYDPTAATRQGSARIGSGSYKDYEGRVISVEADVSEALALFEGLEVNKKAITKNLMRTVGAGARQAVKKQYNHYLHKRSGKLYKSIRYVIATGKMGNVDAAITNDANSGKPTSKDGRIARYGFMLASGYNITPKHARFLQFQVNGQWVRKYNIRVAPVDWVEPPVLKYVDSGDAREKLDKALQKQVDYWDKRLGGGVIKND